MDKELDDGYTIDLTVEKLTMEFFLRNIKDGKITPDYCMELISRSAAAEAENFLLQQEVINLRETVGRLYEENTQLKVSRVM